MKIGILGGTFDPIHNGHLMLGEEAFRQFKLNEVWFMPNGNPPHKHAQSIRLDTTDRVQMVQLAIADYPMFHLCEYEVKRHEVSYSFETIEYFNELYPTYEFYFIIGADSLFAIESWAHPERLFSACTILASYRDDLDTPAEMNVQIEYLKKKYCANIKLLISPLIDISSSEIRDLTKEGGTIHDMVPKEIEAYIQGHALYVR